MDPDWPLETVVTVTFVPKGSRTVLTLHQTVSESLAKRTGAHPSWLQMFDRLAALVASGRALELGAAAGGERRRDDGDHDRDRQRMPGVGRLRQVQALQPLPERVPRPADVASMPASSE